MVASLFKKFRPTAKKAVTYRGLPSVIDHQRVALESIAAEGEIGEKLSCLLQRFPEESVSLDTLIEGYRQFSRAGITPPDAYYAFRHLYFRTKGVANAVIGEHLSSIFPKPPLPPSISSIFGSFSEMDIRRIVSFLAVDGCYRLDQKLPPTAVRELVESMDREGPTDCHGDATVTHYHESALLSWPALTRIATDPLLYFIASEYLNVEPVLCFLSAWISRPHPNTTETLSKNAQLFHSDMSNPGFLKAFIYLNDVSETNGPHCAVPKTHRKKAEDLWKDGRIGDDEMTSYYPRETWQVYLGGAGSIFLVDTSAFHKGVPLVDGHRRMVQFYYTNTLFGDHVPTNKEYPAFYPWHFGGDLRDYTPRLFERYALASKQAFQSPP